MKLSLDSIAFLGRELNDYKQMFSLTETDLSRSTILDVAAGPASFNAEVTQRGGNVISVDPLYCRSASALALTGEMDLQEVFNQMPDLTACFNLRDGGDISALRERRHRALKRFCEDYSHGRATGRYIAGELPALPFESDSIDLVLSANLLFLYSDQLSTEFHLSAVKELLRIARNEVRLYPLVGMDGKESPHLQMVKVYLNQKGYQYTTSTVQNEVLKGSNQMLRIAV